MVLDASLEATRWGVCTGISKSLARRRCPELVCVDHNPDWCAGLFERVWSEFARITPLVEPVDLHKGFLDFTGCFPRHAKIAEILNAALWRLHFETGLESAWGGGQDKWMARLAREQNEWISPEHENAFLNQVSIQQLGMGGALCERLQRYGILSVGSLFRTPHAFLQSHLQLTSRDLQPLLKRNSSPVRALFPPPVLEAEASLPWEDDEEMARAIHAISEDATRKLHKCHQQSGQLRVVFRSPADQRVCERKLAKPARNAESLETILHRMIMEEQPRDLRTIKLVLERLSPAPQWQGELWQSASQRTETSEPLEKARQVLERKYGYQTVQSGSDYASRIPPRFAQLIYAQREIYLP